MNLAFSRTKYKKEIYQNCLIIKELNNLGLFDTTGLIFMFTIEDKIIVFIPIAYLKPDNA